MIVFFHHLIIVFSILIGQVWAGDNHTAPDGIPWKFSTQEKVVAIGDIHGDFTALVKILKESKLIDESGKWIGGKTQLVFTGDLVDRGNDARPILDLIISLENQAKKAGGQIHTLLGNHDIMALSNDFRYLGAEEAAFFAGPGKTPLQQRRAMVRAYSETEPYASWLRQRNSVVQIGDTLFVHAGLEVNWANPKSVGEVNSLVRSWVKSMQEYHQGSRELPDKKTQWVLEEKGPLWSRTIADKKMSPNDLDKILASMDANQIVLGHTTKNGVIRTAYQDKVILIDTGISESFDGELTALEIVEGKRVHKVYTRPSKADPLLMQYKKLWEQGELPSSAFSVDENPCDGSSSIFKNLINHTWSSLRNLF